MEPVARLHEGVAKGARGPAIEAQLAPHGLTPPKFADYAPTMVEFFRAHEDDPAFRPA